MLGAVTVALLVFNYFSGALVPSPVTLSVDALDKLGPPNGQPIIVYPVNDPPVNITYSVATFTDNNLHPITAYLYWYQWAPNSQHQANDWEPVYCYFDTYNPANPLLTGIGSRFHFQWRLRTSGFNLPNNGTAPLIIFSTVFHIPLTGSSISLVNVLRATNETSSITAPYTPIYDPNSPYSYGSNAYETGGGPLDPAILYGGTLRYTNGLLFGFIAGFAAFGFFQLDIRLLRRLFIK